MRSFFFPLVCVSFTPQIYEVSKNKYGSRYFNLINYTHFWGRIQRAYPSFSKLIQVNYGIVNQSGRLEKKKKTEMFLSTEPCLMDNFDMISFYLRSFFGDVLERVCWTIKSFNRHLKYTHTKCLFCCAILVRHSVFPGLSLCLQ